MKNKLKQKIVRRNKMAESMYRQNRNTYVKPNEMAKWWKIMKNMNRKEKKWMEKEESENEIKILRKEKITEKKMSLLADLIMKLMNTRKREENILKGKIIDQ